MASRSPRSLPAAVVAAAVVLLTSCSVGGLPDAPTDGASGGSSPASGSRSGSGSGADGSVSTPSGERAGGSGAASGAAASGAGAAPRDSHAGSSASGTGPAGAGSARAGAGSAGAGSAGAGSAGVGSNGQPGDGPSTTATAPVTISIGRSVEFAGWTVTVKSLTTKPPAFQGLPPTATLDMVFDNPSDINGLFDGDEYGNDWLTLSCGNHHYTADGNIDFPEVPGHSRGEGTASFTIDESFDPTTAVLTIGGSTETQSVLPLGTAGTKVDGAPQKVEGTATLTSDKVTVTITKVELRTDLPKALKQAPSDKQYLLFTFDTHNKRSGEMDSVVMSDSHFTLTEPSGNTIEADDQSADGWYSDAAVATVLPQSSRTGLVLTFVIDKPATGSYQLNYNVDSMAPNTHQKATDTWKFTI